MDNGVGGGQCVICPFPSESQCFLVLVLWEEEDKPSLRFPLSSPLSGKTFHPQPVTHILPLTLRTPGLADCPPHIYSGYCCQEDRRGLILKLRESEGTPLSSSPSSSRGCLALRSRNPPSHRASTCFAASDVTNDLRAGLSPVSS